MRSGVVDQPSTGDLGDRLRALLDEIAGQNVDALRTDEAGAWIRDVQRAINRLESERTRRVRAFDARGGVGPEGARSCAPSLSEDPPPTPHAAHPHGPTA